MRNYLIAIGAAITLSGAGAEELPFRGEFTISYGDVIVGTGELEDGKLKLRLLAHENGFDGTLQIVGADGVLVEYQVTVGADGSVLMWDSLVDLNQAVSGAGGEIEIEYEDNLDYAAHAHVDGSTGLQLASERAAEQAQDALAQAASKADRTAVSEDEEAGEGAVEAGRAASERASDGRTQADDRRTTRAPGGGR